MTKETDTSGDERGNGIQVIARAATILNALGEMHQGMSLGEIAKAVDLPRSTVQRIVQALAQEGMVQADRSDGVRLGPALLKLVTRVHTDVVAIATPHLEAVVRDLGETVALGRVSGRQLAFVRIFVAERHLRVVPQMGADLPLHSTSGGRVLLALHSDDEVRALVGEHYERVTEHTIHSAAALAAQLKAIRAAGYGFEQNETELGISSVAIAIDTVFGRYSVSVAVPSARFEQQRAGIIARVLDLKRALQLEIGRQ